jgi:hypothetical protein
MTSDVHAKNVKIVETVCTAMLKSLSIQVITSNVILSIANAVSNVLIDPTVVSNSSLTDCASALATVVNSDPTEACSDSTAVPVWDAFSSLLLKGHGMPASVLSVVDHAIVAFAGGCQLSQAAGQTPLNLLSTNIRISVAVRRAVDLSSTLLQVPLTGFESLENGVTSYARVLPLDSTNTHPAGLFAMEYMNNPINASVTAASVYVQVNTYDQFSTNGVQSQASVPDYYVVLELQNLAPVSYTYIPKHQMPLIFCERAPSEYTVSRECPDGTVMEVVCPGVQGYFNITCSSRAVTPYCTSWDGAEFMNDADCTVIAASSTNTTCQCLINSQSSSSRRVLTQMTATTSLALFSATYYTVVHTVPTQWIQSPLIEEAANNKIVITALGSVLGIILLGSFVVYAWDWRWKMLLSAAVHIEEKVDHKTTRTFSDFFEGIFPDEFRADRWYRSYFHWFMQKHWLFGLLYPRFHGRKTFYNAFNYLVTAVRVFNFTVVTTIVISLLYPDNGKCEAIHDADECLSARSIGSTRHLCRWDNYLQYCTFHTPPRDDVFSIVLLMAVVTAVCAPLHKLVKFMLRHAASPHTQQALTKERKRAELIRQAAVDYRLDEFQLSQTPKATILRAARLDKSQRTMDYVLPEEEAMAVLAQGEDDFGRLFSHHIFQHSVDEFSYKQLRYGFQRLNSKDLLRRVKTARNDAGKIRAELERISIDEDKEAFLMKSFIVDYFSGFERTVARRYFFHHWESSKLDWMRRVRRICCLIALPGYIVAGIFLIAFFNIPIGSRAGYYWTTVLVLSVCEDIIVLQPSYIWVRMTAVTTLVADDCRNILADLKKKGKLIMMRTWGLMKHSNSLVQHFNPACRAARMFPHLPVSRFLMSISDYDLPVPSQFKRALPEHDFHRHLSTSLYFMGFLPPVIQDAFIEMGICGLFNGLLLALAMLARISVAGAVLVAIALILMVFAREAYISFQEWLEAKSVADKHQRNMFYSIEDDEFVIKNRNLEFASIDQSKFAQAESPVGKSAGRFRSLFGIKKELEEDGGPKFASNTIVLGGSTDHLEGLNALGEDSSMLGPSLELDQEPNNNFAARSATSPTMTAVRQQSFQSSISQTSPLQGGVAQQPSVIQSTEPSLMTMPTMSMTLFDKSMSISGPPIQSRFVPSAPAGPGAAAMGSVEGLRLGLGADESPPPSSDVDGVPVRTLREVGLRAPPRNALLSSSMPLPTGIQQQHQQQPLPRSLTVSQSADGAVGPQDYSDKRRAARDRIDDDSVGSRNDESNASSTGKYSRTKARKARSIERGRRLRTLASQQLEDDMSLPSLSSAAHGDVNGQTGMRPSLSPSRDRLPARAGGGVGGGHATPVIGRVLDDDGESRDSRLSVGSEADDYSHRRRRRGHDPGPGSQPDRLIGFNSAGATSAINYLASSADDVRLPIEESPARRRPQVSASSATVPSGGDADTIPASVSPVQPTPARSQNQSQGQMQQTRQLPHRSNPNTQQHQPQTAAPASGTVAATGSSNGTANNSSQTASSPSGPNSTNSNSNNTNSNTGEPKYPMFY